MRPGAESSPHKAKTKKGFELLHVTRLSADVVQQREQLLCDSPGAVCAAEAESGVRSVYSAIAQEQAAALRQLVHIEGLQGKWCQLSDIAAVAYLSICLAHYVNAALALNDTAASAEPLDRRSHDHLDLMCVC